MIKKQDASGSVSLWSKAAEKSVLSAFREIEDSKKPIKNKWKMISQKVSEEGYDGFTSEQCRLKIKSCKEKYQRAEKIRNRSGSATPSIADNDDEMEAIFHGLPDVKPVSTMDSDVMSSGGNACI